jgi:type II restriction enzyme
VNKGKFTIHYLSADLQVPEMFIPRKPLSETAVRAGWQGFMYDLTKVSDGAIVKVY